MVDQNVQRALSNNKIIPVLFSNDSNDKENNIKIGTAKKALKAEVDVFLTFGESTDRESNLPKNEHYKQFITDIQADLGPFSETSTKSDVIQALKDAPVTRSGWVCVKVPLSIHSNAQPKGNRNRITHIKIDLKTHQI